MDNIDASTDQADQYLQLMSVVEIIAEAKKDAQTILDTGWTPVQTLEQWDRIERTEQFLLQLSTLLIDLMPDAVKVLANPAVMAHIEAVKSSD